MNLTTSIHKYWEWIQANPNKTNEKIKTLYEKLNKDLDGETIERINKENGEIETIEYVFDYEKAQRPIQFLEKFCHHSKGTIILYICYISRTIFCTNLIFVNILPFTI